MPLVFRSMIVAPDDKPLVENSARGLGVRVGTQPTDDLATNHNGNVQPESGGMSVAKSWRDLELHRIPKRLRHLVPMAAGSNRDRCWRMGQGEFASGPITNDLQLRRDRLTHGFIEPAREVPLNEYLAALAATRDQWVIDER